MAYQVLARKWRPQRFEEIVGQPAVTRTLRNAIVSGRIAHAFVFAGPRGVGKTTTARILARALNCEKGPTPDPCGACAACVEIAEGRDLDVLEIDAATHTQVENVREVIIASLPMVPVRDRYKVFIIDEVHQLSAHSFNALLKSIEEPPPHVIFMMATTEPGKIPDTVLSRSQVFELRAIGAPAIAEQLKKIARAERIRATDEAVTLIARAAEGSMRDAQSALDQVIAFAGESISADDVATVLGLVGRDLLFDIVSAVASEDAPAAFDLSGRASEAGYDLRLVCRELSRLVRDLMVLSIDRSRVNDPEIAPEGEGERLLSLSARFSREDLLRAFGVLTEAEAEIRGAAQPRHHLEMALLRWMHLRKLTPLAELIEQLGGPPARPEPLRRGEGPQAGGTPPSRGPMPSAREPSPRGPSAEQGSPRGPSAEQGSPRGPSAEQAASRQARPPDVAAHTQSRHSAPAEAPEKELREGVPPEKAAFLAEIKRAKSFFYNTVVAQARTIDFGPDKVTFGFAPAHRTLREQLQQNRDWLESLAARQLGRKVTVAASEQPTAPSAAGQEAREGLPPIEEAREGLAPSQEARQGLPPSQEAREGLAPSQQAREGLLPINARRDEPELAAASGVRAAVPDLKAAALADTGVQAMLEVFPAEIKDVEEM